MNQNTGEFDLIGYLEDKNFPELLVMLKGHSEIEIRSIANKILDQYDIVCRVINKEHFNAEFRYEGFDLNEVITLY